MIKIIFVCHGNICRSVAAEYIFKNLLQNRGIFQKFAVISRATSTEEIGNDIYPPMKRELMYQDIPFGSHRAQQITQSDYDWADYIFYMDQENLWGLNRLLHDSKQKFHRVTTWTEGLDEISDPWYSGEYHLVIEELKRCAEDILKNLLK